MRLRDEWSQDVVLSAMCDSIAQIRDGDGAPDFILATGDLAFSGSEEEYELVKRFFDAISTASNVPKNRIFCIPGNHDVNRDRQTMCFSGARAALTSSNIVDQLLAPEDNLATLTQRQQAYRDFQQSYFIGQPRVITAEGLGYVATLTIDDVVIAIIGLNSAWLAQGGDEDHGKLLIGERQVINAFDTAAVCSPHIVIAMAHHPLHLLREFDRNAVTTRVNDRCQFFHCGHLHEPEARGAGLNATGCLTVAAGASFETRETHNTFSHVALRLAEGTRTLRTVLYDKGTCTFAYSKSEEFPLQLTPATTCSVKELADAIITLDRRLTQHAYYLAALLLEQKTDVPLPAQGGHVFAAVAVLQRQPADDFRRKTIEFVRFKNILTVFFGRVPLQTLIEQRGRAVQVYGLELLRLCKSDPFLAERLHSLDVDVREFEAAQPKVSFTVDLFADLVLSQEWDLLREQASRHLGSSDPPVATQAKRMLALALAHQSDDASRTEAIKHLENLVSEGYADVQDRKNLATLLINLGRYDDAKAVLIAAIRSSANQDTGSFSALGQRIVEQTGDRDFRKRLDAAIAARGSHE